MPVRRILALGLAVLVAASSMGAADPMVLDARAMRQLASKAIDAGFAQDALEIVAQLLARDPADSTALILKSQALRILGQLPQAEAAARAAFAAAETDNGRYGAAMVLAQALSLQDRRIEAQLWLRRAAEEAPSAKALSIARRDFDLVRANTPLKLSFAMSMSPSSNVNNGALDPVFELPSGYICPTGCLGGATGAALALSGFEGAVGMAAQLRWHDSQTAQGLLAATVNHGFVILSEAAQSTAPTARASDFALTSLDLAVTEKRYEARHDTIYDGSVNLGRVWYGGAALTDYAAGKVEVAAPVSETITLRTSLSHQWQFSAESGSLSARLSDGSLGLDAGLPGGDRIGAEVGFGVTTAPDVFAENERWSLQLSWQAHQPVLGMGLSALAQFETLDYPESFYAFEGRHDRAANLSVSAQLDKLDYMGFVPVISLEAGRNWSNIGLYDSETFGLGLSVTSKF